MDNIIDIINQSINNYKQANASELNFVGNTGIGESQYDEGINPESLNYINNLRANRQGHWDSFANMLVRGASKALLTVPESAGYLLDLPEILGAQREFDNVVSNWARSQKESLDENLPEYSRFTEEGGEFNPLDMEFYMRGGDSVIESLGYLVPGFGIGGATARGLSLIGKLSGNVIKGASALTAAVGTNYIESMQVAGQTYRDLISKGVDPEIAATEAKEIIWQGKSMIALELPQYLTLFRGFGTSRAMKGAGDSFVKFKARDYGMQMGSEAIEEIGLDFISKDNERDALLTQGLIQDDNSNISQRFIDYASSDEGLTAGFLGALGGVLFQGGGDVINYASDVIKKEKTESQRYSEALGQISQNKDLTKEILKANTTIFKEQQEKIKNNDPVGYKSLQREALKNLAFANAEKGTYSQFLDTLDTLSSMKEDEAAKVGLNTQEINELSQVFKKDAKVYENLYTQATQISSNRTIQQKGFNILADKYLADNTVVNAQAQINKIYTENTSSTFGPTKQRVNKLVNQQALYNKYINSIKDTTGPKAEFKQLLQKKLSNINQQIQQEIENLNSYVDSEFTIDEYAKLKGKKLTEKDFENSLVDSQIQQQENNLIVSQFESLKAEEAYRELINPQVQEQIIKQEEEVKAEEIKQAEKEATKALTDEFNELAKTPEVNLARLEEINKTLSNTPTGKDINLKLNKIKSDLNKKAKETQVTPTEVKTPSIEDVFGTTENNITVATSDSSNSSDINKDADNYKERKKSETKSGAYLDLEYVESSDGTMIASLRDDNGNVIPAERMIQDSNDYSKYPPGTEISIVIDEDWKSKNNIPNTNWWELPIAMQIGGKTLIHIPAFKAEPKDGVTDENIQKKYADVAQERIQKELIAERKYLVEKLLAGETVTGKITDYGTGAIDGYTKEQGEVINRLGNGTNVFKDIQFAVVDKGAAQFKLLTEPSSEFYVDNNLVTSEHFSKLPNGSVVVLLPSYARNSANQNELVPRAIDRTNLSETDINIVLHLIETYGKYNSDAAQKAIGLVLPEGTKNVTEYLINNYVYNGKNKGSYFEVEMQKGERVVKVKDSTGAVTNIIPVKNKVAVASYLSTLRYNIHSNPYFKLDFDNSKITKAEPLDSRNVIAERTKTNIDNTTFTIINSAENKMQIFRQPAIYYSIDKPQLTKKAPIQKRAQKPVKETSKTATPVDKKADIEKRRQEEFNQYANDIIAKTELYEDGEGRKYLVHTLKSGKKRLDTANEEGKRTSTLDVYEGSVPVENYITDAKKISDIERQPSKQENRINAKYDAELKALEGKKADAQTVKNRMQEIEKQPVSINVTTDASGKMEQTSEEVVSQIKAELDKIGLPYSDVVANDKGSTYFVVTKDGQQHEILKLVKTGNALVKPVLTKAKWINHLIKTQPEDLYNFVNAELAALETPKAGSVGVVDVGFISPLVKNTIEENGLTESDVSKIKGTGFDGRILKSDVDKYVQELQSLKEQTKAETKVTLPQAKYNAIINANEKTIASVLKAELGATDLFREFNKAFKESGLTSRLEFAKQYFQVEEAKQDNTNNPPTDSLKSTISSLDNSKLQTINEVEKSTNPYTKLVEMIINNTDTELRSLIFKITPLLGNVNIQFTTEVSNELAKVVYADNKIIINKYAVARNPRALEYVVAHEMLHLATLKGLTTNSEFNKNITKLYNQVKKELDGYALSNVREFVSEAYTNPEFKEQLKGIKYEATNVFEKFWQWIKGLFNLQDNVFNLVDKYTNQYLMNYVTDLNGNIIEDKLISDYQIEGMSLQESYNMIQSMTGIAQDIFKDADANIPVLELHKQVYNKLKERYEEAKELDELSNNVLLMYETILANEGDNDTFKKLLNRFDKNLVYLQNILSKEFDEADIDLDFDEEYSTVGNENYGREAFQDNPKDKASIRLKRFLAFIPDTAYNSDKTSYFTLENEFGLKQYVPYDVIYNTIVQFTANTPFNKMKSKLEDIATGNSTIKVVLDKLEELRLSDKPADKLLYNEFWSNFKKQHATFATTIFQNKKSDNKNKVIYSNRKDAKFTLIDRWYTEFKNTYLTSKLVEIEDGKYKINNKVATQLREDFNKATQIKNKLEQGLAYSNILKQVGITVNKDAVELLLNKPDLFKYKTADAALERLKQATSRITLRLEEKADNKEINESNNNPFTRETKQAGENTSLEFLAEMQIYVDNSLLSSMFRNEEGKNIYSIFNNTIVSEIMTNLKDKESRETLLNNWSNSAFHKDNYLVKQLIDGTLDPKDLELVLMSTMAQDKKSNSGKPYKNLTEQERQVTQLINFLSPKSLFQFPTLSDKPTIPFFHMKKVNVSIKDGKLNDKALDAVYSIFLQEANRIIKANNDINNIEQKNLLIPNYHIGKKGKEGNALTFMFLPQLNNLQVTLGEETYSLKEALIKQEDISENVEAQVKEELNKIALQYINQTKQYYDNLGISYNGKVKEKFANDKDGSLIANFTINNMIAKASIFTIFNNDPAYAKDIDDVSKRGAALTAPGQDLFDEEGSNFNSLIINDVVFKAKNNKNLLDYFTKLYKSADKAKEFLQPYTDLNGTDAQAYVSVKFYEDIMNKLGRDTTVYQPLKLVYTQDVWDSRTNNYIRKYIKFSAFPLFEDLTRPNGKPIQLDSFRLDMEAKGVDFVAFESASKLGTQGLQSVYKNGILLPIDTNNVINLPLSGMRLQQEVPYDADKNKINVVSQGRKLLFGDLLAIEGYDNIVGLKDTFDTLYQANVLESFEDLKNELGLKLVTDDPNFKTLLPEDSIVNPLIDMNRYSSNSYYTITNVEGLKDLLSEEIVSRSNNENLLEGLELEEVDGVKRFKIPLYFSPNNQSFESLLFSLVSNGVIKQKHTGKSYVQGSEFGFYDVVTSIPADIADKIEWVRDNNTKSLDTFQVKDNKLEPEGILLPNIYRNILKEGQEVPESLLKVFGFRIPNQGHNSMASLKIQGFLPAEAGDLVIVTPEMLKRMGSDFDVDKLYLYFYNVKNTKDGLKKVEYLTDENSTVEERYENFIRAKVFEFINKDADKRDADFYNQSVEDYIEKVKTTNAFYEINQTEFNFINNRIEEIKTKIKETNDKSVKKELFEVLDELHSEIIYYSKPFREALKVSKKAKEVKESYFEYFRDLVEKQIIPIEEFTLKSIELQNSKKARQNAILDIYFEVFSNPAILEKAMMPNDIKPLVDAVNAIVPQDKQVKDILTVETQDDYFKANLGGKTGVGITSLWNTFFSQMQYYNVSIAGQGIMFKDSKGEVIRPKDEKGNYIGDNKLGLTNLSDIKGKINNSFISNILQIFQSAAVDNAKEQIMDKAGLNAETLDVAQMIAMSGIDDLELIVAFLKQPYIEKYVDFSQRIRTRFEDFERGSYKERAIKKALDSLNSQLKDLGKETYSTFNNESVAFSKEELKEFLKFEDKKSDLPYYTGLIKPEENTIFVFGSNPEGRHGAGAAKVAREQFGAIYGQGEGLQGNAYALPTKDLRVKENNGFKSISPSQITESIKKLYQTAKENPTKQFKVGYTNTIDKSLNGYTGLEMIDMFNNAGKRPFNIIFSKEWVDTGKLNITSSTQDKVKFLQGQYQILSNFINYKDKAEVLGKAITAYNIDTKSVGKNYYEVKQAIAKYKAYFVRDNPDLPFDGLKEMGNNPFVKALYQNGLLVAETAFNRPDILPFNNKFFKELYSQAAEILEKEDLSAQDIKLLNKTALWYITSMENNGIFEEDIKGLRERLLTSTETNPSLARRIKELVNEGYDNWLIQRLTIDEDKISYYRNTIEKSEEILAVISFNQLLSDYPEIGKELIQYSYLTSGGNPTATGFSNIIPVTELNKLGFGKFYNNKAFQQELDKDSFIDTFWTQYYQNNPTKAFNGENLDNQKLTDKNIKFTTEKVLPKFIYLYVEQEDKKAETILFKKNPNFEKENVYYPLALLDNEYAANQALTSINPENNKYASFPIQNTFETKESLKDKIDNLEKPVEKELTKETLVNYNTEQIQAIEQAVDFINNGNPNEYWLIQGKAGTGKTTIAQEIAKQFPNKAIYVAALSHKAKTVIKDKFNDAKIPAQFHSLAGLLGQKMDLESGKFERKEDDFSEIPIQYADIVFIDEASMINEQAIDLIYQFKPAKTKVIFLGDIGQLPPIRTKDNPYYTNKEKLLGRKSPVFNTTNKSLLEERVRQGEESPILPFADLYWENSQTDNAVTNPASKKQRQNIITNKGALIFTNTFNDIKESVLESFKKAIDDKNPNYIKIVTYKNDTRNSINKYIHNTIFGQTAKEFNTGELIIFNNNFGDIENATETQILDSSEVLTDSNGLKYINVRGNINGALTSFPIILSESKPEHKKAVTEAFNYAFSLKGGDRKAYAKAIKDAWALKDKFADVDYGYAITSHKSQGSTYDIVVVHEKDIMSVAPLTNKGKSESIYTALTRPKNIAIVVSVLEVPTTEVNIENLNSNITQNKIDNLPTQTQSTTYQSYQQILKDNNLKSTLTETEFNLLSEKEKEALIWQAKNCPF